MAVFIVLTAPQAEQVQGPGDLPDTSLEPRPINGGLFILPLSVLSDPAHAEQREFLQSLSQREVSADEFPAEVSI